MQISFKGKGFIVPNLKAKRPVTSHPVFHSAALLDSSSLHHNLPSSDFLSFAIPLTGELV
jgi:hypothetical protein